MKSCLQMFVGLADQSSEGTGPDTAYMYVSYFEFAMAVVDSCHGIGLGMPRARVGGGMVEVTSGSTTVGGYHTRRILGEKDSDVGSIDSTK